MEQLQLIEGTKYARKCDITGEPMNDGWVFGNGEEYAKYENDAKKLAIEYGYGSLQDAYDDDSCYWTEWDDEGDYLYIVKDGQLQEIEN